MSENDRRAHEDLLMTTGRFSRKERDETINRLMGDLKLELEEDVESTLELPTLKGK
jgi:hypothetical protein